MMLMSPAGWLQSCGTVWGWVTNQKSSLLLNSGRPRVTECFEQGSTLTESNHSKSVFFFDIVLKIRTSLEVPLYQRPQWWKNTATSELWGSKTSHHPVWFILKFKTPDVIRVSDTDCQEEVSQSETSKTQVNIPAGRKRRSTAGSEERGLHGRSSVPANHGGFGQTSGGRQRLGPSGWRKIRSRCGPQQHGYRGLARRKQHKEKTNKQKPIRETANDRQTRGSIITGGSAVTGSWRPKEAAFHRSEWYHNSANHIQRTSLN